MLDITLTSLETIDGFSMAGDYLFTLDELQNAKIANTQDKQDITGKGGRKLNSLKKGKAVTVSATNGLLSGGLLELQTGNKFEKLDTASVKWPDYLTIKTNKATTTFKATGTAGAEIGTVYVKGADGEIAQKLTQNSEAGEGTFAYNPENKELSFNASDFEDGTEIVVYYFRQIKADVLKNSIESYSEKCQLYINAFGEDQCGNVFRVQFYIPRADINGNFDIDMGDNQVVHAFEAESQSLSKRCGGGAEGGVLWTYTVFGKDAADAGAGA